MKIRGSNPINAILRPFHHTLGPFQTVSFPARFSKKLLPLQEVLSTTAARSSGYYQKYGVEYGRLLKSFQENGTCMHYSASAAQWIRKVLLSKHM